MYGPIASHDSPNVRAIATRVLMFNLNDIRYFLAVAESGSLSAASRTLGVTQPTVGRRIQDIENALGARLFERSLSGYQLSGTGLEILDSAKAIEKHAWNIDNRIGGESDLTRGRVRLTVAEGLGVQWLPSLLPQFHDQHPHTRLDIFVHNTFLDLLRRQADIAIRIGQPGSDLLIGKVLCQVNFGLYASNEYCERYGAPQSLDDLSNHQNILATGELAKTRQMAQLSELLGDSRQHLFTDSMVAQLSYIKMHLGISPLPDYVVASEQGLTRVLEEQFSLSLPLWVLTHRELRDSQHIRHVKEFLAARLVVN